MRVGGPTLRDKTRPDKMSWLLMRASLRTGSFSLLPLHIRLLITAPTPPCPDVKISLHSPTGLSVLLDGGITNEEHRKVTIKPKRKLLRKKAGGPSSPHLHNHSTLLPHHCRAGRWKSAQKKPKKNWVCFYSNVMILTFQDSTDAVWWNSVVPVRQKILIQEFAEDPSGQPGVEPFLWPCQV